MFLMKFLPLGAPCSSSSFFPSLQRERRHGRKRTRCTFASRRRKAKAASRPPVTWIGRKNKSCCLFENCSCYVFALTKSV